ncbi:UNVERIFIED_CONTAM: CDP-diacylglycerol--glycerol-3-phosphate 3-phosphatidyltransferase [Siphonaria sp. JEL0065]|nr:CDP-diacylglycerol--glycerol-3-phosphate 3-phosphatidyltransferase [Siphonaria sp. JEL0065]
MDARAADIHIIDSPPEFYTALLNGIDRAQSRIALASLYIGEKEVNLQQALHQKLAAHKNVQLHVLVDAMRGSRKDAKTGASTVSLLTPLKLKFQNQTTISLFEFPSANPFRKLVPQRFNEAFGLQHIKVYVFDDDVIISGANLNKDYFQNRQDRYILIKNNPQVANYFSALLKTIGQHSHTVTSNPEPTLQIQKCSSSLLEMSTAFKSFEQKTINALPPSALTNAANPSPLIPNPETGCSTSDTVITPILQSGPLNIHTETNLLTNLLKNLSSSPDSTVTCSSAYFNLPEKLQPLVLDSRAKFSFLLAAPEANGFFGSRGVSKHLPFAYTYLTVRFWEKVLNIPDGKQRIQMRLWISQSSSSNISTYPHWTLVGSSNYGYRSYCRDLEAQVVIQTRNKDLQKRLGDNLQQLQAYSNRVDESNFASLERRPNVLVRLATRIIKGLL